MPTPCVRGGWNGPRIIHLKPIPQPAADCDASGQGGHPGGPSPRRGRQTCPGLSVKEWTDGKTRSLTDYRGKVVVLDFWGIRSGRCGFTMPVIKNLEARYRDRGVVFIGVHTADTDVVDVRNFLEQIKFNLPTAVDSGEDETANCTASRLSRAGLHRPRRPGPVDQPNNFTIYSISSSDDVMFH